MLFDYSVLLNSKLALLAYTSLALAILSLWIKRSPRIWGSLLFIAVAVDFFVERLQWFTIAFIAIFAIFSYLTFHGKRRPTRIGFGILTAIFALLLLLHRIPGFTNWLIIQALVLSDNAIPFSMYLNFDKPLITLFILGFSGLPLLHTKTAWRAAVKGSTPIALIGICVISILSIMMGYVKFDLKFPSIFPIWALNNLILVCTAEEVFFRGFVQRILEQIFIQYRLGKSMALALASLFFGALHFQGGIQYVILTSIAGLFYGKVYQKTSSIEASIVAHFLLNVVHFLAFTYPALSH